MTALATRTWTATGRNAPSGSWPRHAEPAGSTLEDVILGVWEDLRAQSHADCPVCGERDRLAAGGCSACGSALN